MVLSGWRSRKVMGCILFGFKNGNAAPFFRIVPTGQPSLKAANSISPRDNRFTTTQMDDNSINVSFPLAHPHPSLTPQSLSHKRIIMENGEHVRRSEKT